MNKRTREIVLWLLEKKQYQQTCNIAELMRKFKVSERTIRYDLDEIVDFLLANKCQPLQFKDHGQIELNDDYEKIGALLGQNDFYSFKLSKEERIDMIAYLIVNTNDHITLQQLADILFVSRSTIIHDLDDVRSMMSDHNLEIVSLRKGLRVHGKESSRRILLMYLLRKPYIQQYRLDDANASIFEVQDLDILREIIKDGEIEGKRFLTDGSFADLLKYLMISIERHHHHQFVEIDYALNHSSMQNMASHLMEKMDNYFGLEYRLQEEYLLSDILYNLHYLSRNDTDEAMMQIQVISKQFIDALAKDLNVNLTNDFQFYQNLTNHLQSTFKDIDMGYANEIELLDEVVKKNRLVVEAIEKNITPLERYVNRKINKDEIAYITIHVCAAIERNKYQGQQFTILLVCNSGVGTSQLLLSRLKKYFQFYVADVLPVHALMTYDITGIDLIISTAPIKEERCDSIILHPYLTDEDCILLGEKLEVMKSKLNRVNTNPSFQRLQTMIANSIAKSPLDKDEIYKNIIKDLSSHFFPIAPSDKATLRELLSAHIQVDVECKDWKEAVEKSALPLLEEGYLTEGYIQQMIRNIEQMGPYIVLAQGFALPHEAPDMGGKKLGMNLIRLKEPVSFHSQFYDPVEFVCTLSTIDKDSHLKAMFHLMNLLSKVDFCENIRKVKTAEEIYQIIYEYEAIL